MRIPGFNAEGSLYRARAGHRAASLHGARADSQGVYPQLPKSIGFCMDECDSQYDWGSVDNAYCKSQCSGDGGDGGTGGGGGGFPQVHCGKCATVGSHKGQKLCTIPGRGSYYSDC